MYSLLKSTFRQFTTVGNAAKKVKEHGNSIYFSWIKALLKEIKSNEYAETLIELFQDTKIMNQLIEEDPKLALLLVMLPTHGGASNLEVTEYILSQLKGMPTMLSPEDPFVSILPKDFQQILI